MTRVYDVKITLRDIDPESKEQKINVSFSMTEEDANLANIDLLGEVFASTVQAIREADRERSAK